MTKRLYAAGVRSVASCLALASLFVAGAEAEAAVADWLPSNAALTTQPGAISQTVEGVVVTARGYVAEFGSNTSEIIGPFPTSTVGTRQIFGNLTASPDPAASAGLGLFVVATPGNNVSGFDYGGANVEPYIDSGICESSPCSYVSDNPDIPGAPRPKMDFVLFTFSKPVNISSFVTSTANDWWAAGWASLPSLTLGLEGALSTASAVHAKDNTNASDLNAFIHQLPTFQSVVAMLVAVPPPVSGFGVRALNSQSSFAISNVQFATAVPEPSTYTLLAGGIFLIAYFVGVRSRR